MALASSNQYLKMASDLDHCNRKRYRVADLTVSGHSEVDMTVAVQVEADMAVHF